MAGLYEVWQRAEVSRRLDVLSGFIAMCVAGDDDARRRLAQLVADADAALSASPPDLVVAVDPSPGQYEMAAVLFGHLEPRLRIVLCDAVSHLKTTANTYDVLYSVFGALDFTDPRDLLPAAFFALKPGGRLVFSSLAHYTGGAPAQPDVVAASVPARTPEGEAATMHRWVLQEHVWVKVLDEAGFTGISVDMLPSAVQGPRAADTLLMTATRRP